MPGICEARTENNSFGVVCWDIDWKAQEKRGQALYESCGCEAGMMACLK